MIQKNPNKKCPQFGCPLVIIRKNVLKYGIQAEIKHQEYISKRKSEINGIVKEINLGTFKLQPYTPEKKWRKRKGEGIDYGLEMIDREMIVFGDLYE